MTGPERVSVVLPFFRAERYLAQAVESVLGQQGYTNWRLYLINDGSDEADSPIARQYCRLYPDQLQLLEHPGKARRGTSASRNLGMRSARGDLIAFLDADDIWYPHKLAFQVALIDANPGADMIYGPALRWHSWNGGVDEHVPARVDRFGSDCLVPGEALLETFLRDEALTPCTGSVLIRHAALKRCGYFEHDFPGLFDDQVLYAKLCLSGDVFVSSNCVSSYRKHDESCCSQAAINGSEAAERKRFLSWLGNYRQSPARQNFSLR
jgi:glycosyltransferase involved in cell wall biosynthesis